MKLDELKRTLREKFSIAEQFSKEEHDKVHAAKMFEKIVFDEFNKVLPEVKSAAQAREHYYSHPSIVNGARRQEAESKMTMALDSARQTVWQTYRMKFHDMIEPEIAGQIVDDVIQTMTAN